MDFGVMGLDNFTASNNLSENGGEGNIKQKDYGSGFVKQGRTINEDEFLKEFLLTKTNNMLSFSSPNSHSTPPLPYCHHSSAAFAKNTGYSCGRMNGVTMHGVISGFLVGPFTTSQWMELELQALIYKYIDANVPIPSYLLNPIIKAFESVSLSGFSGLTPNALGWGGFHLGFPNSDPEPGRCRRTDGKKWRCSRDAVINQKYCERHMNRGRYRSRKPVEGLPNHSEIVTTSVKPMPMASSKSASDSVPNSLGLSHHQLANFPNNNRNVPEKENLDEVYQHTTILSMTSPKTSLNNNQYCIPKQSNTCEESSTRQEFGLVCSDSLLNPLNRSSSLIDNNEIKSHHSLRQFMDDWPKKLSERSSVLWPTQLSISIPMVTSDFMSCNSSLKNDNILSPLGLSQNFEATTHMGLGVGSGQTRIFSWESSMGGPLGEVLHPTSNEL